MPLLDATNGHIDVNDTSPNSATANSDQFHWTILANEPASGGQPCLVVDNFVTLTGVAKIISLRHGGVEFAYIRQDGNLGITGLFPVTANSNMAIRGQAVDGATAVGTKIGNTNALANATAKIVSFYSDSFATEKAAINAGGFLLAPGIIPLGSAPVQVGGTQANVGGAIGARFFCQTPLTGLASKIAVFYPDNLTTEKMAIDVTGKFRIPVATSQPVIGQAVLVGGTVTVSTTSVETNSLIFLTRAVTGGTIGDLRIGTITNLTSFTIVSASGTDTSTVNWWFVN